MRSFLASVCFAAFLTFSCVCPTSLFGQIEVSPSGISQYIDPGTLEMPGTSIQQPFPETPIYQDYTTPVFPQTQTPFPQGTIIATPPVEGAEAQDSKPPTDASPNPLEEQLATAQLNLDKTKNENAALNTKVDELQMRTEQLTSENGELKEQITTLGETTKSLIANIEKLENRSGPDTGEEKSAPETPDLALMLADDIDADDGVIAESGTASNDADSSETAETPSEIETSSKYELADGASEEKKAGNMFSFIQLSGAWKLTQWVAMFLLGGLALALLAIFKED